MSKPLTDGERTAYAGKAARDIQKHRRAIVGVGNVIRVLSQRMLRYEVTLQTKDEQIEALATATNIFINAHKQYSGVYEATPADMANFRRAIKEATDGS